MIKEDEEIGDILIKQNVPADKRKIILKDIKDKLEKDRTRKLSIKEGGFASLTSGFTDSYFGLYALALKANNFQIGLLNSIPSILSPIFQMIGSRLMEKYSRKKLIINFVALQSLLWIPIAFLSIFFWKNMIIDYLPFILIGFYSLLVISGALAGPAWFSLMGDIVPESIRGRYFSRRNKICSTIALMASILAGLFLDLYKTQGWALFSFSCLFFLAFIFRFISSLLFKKHYEPELKLEDGYYFSLFSFVKKAPHNNFGKFVIFVALIYFSVNIAGPFFTIYMRNDLGFSYSIIMLINISSTIFSLLIIPFWGKFSDKYGNRLLLKIGAFIIPLLPIAWIFSGNPVYLALVPQLIGGIGWAAFNLASSNFIYDSVSQQRRGICVAYYNTLLGAGNFAGALVGGIIAQYINISFMNIFLFIFLISGILRLLVVIIFIPLIKEIRKVEKTPVMHFGGMHAVRGVIYEIQDGLSKVQEKIKKVTRPDATKVASEGAGKKT